MKHEGCLSCCVIIFFLRGCPTGLTKFPSGKSQSFEDGNAGNRGESYSPQFWGGESLFCYSECMPR